MPVEVVNEHNMYYRWDEIAGGNKDILLLIHGLALDSSCWGRFIPFLNNSFTVVQYDIRGHGQSSTGKEPITWDLLREDLHGLIQKLKLTNVHMLAFGYGTHWAVKYAIMYPNYVQSLTLMSLPYMSPNNAHFHLAQHVFPHMKDTMEKGHPNFLRQYEELLKGYTTLGSNDEGLMQYFRVLLSNPTEFLSDMIKLTSNATLLTELADLTCPVLILSGASNVITPEAFINASSFLLKNGTLITIPDASFLLFLEQPEMAAKWVQLFVKRISSTGLSRKDTQRFIQAVFQPDEQQEYRNIPILDVYLMKGFRVEVDSVVIQSGWNQRHARRIFSYLVFHPVTTRDVLCEELFSHLDPDKAKANLKVCLHHLERMLRHPTNPAKGLLFQKGTVSVQYKIKCDLVDFMAVVRQAFVERDPLIRYELCKQLPSSIPEAIFTDNYDNWAVSLYNEIDAQLSHLNDWMKSFGHSV